MGWRNGAKLSSGGFAEGFAAGFVPAYTAKVANDRQKERDEANRAHEMEMMTVKEQMISQREKMKAARGSGAGAKGKLTDTQGLVTFLERNGIPVTESNLAGASEALSLYGGGGVNQWKNLQSAYDNGDMSDARWQGVTTGDTGNTVGEEAITTPGANTGATTTGATTTGATTTGATTTGATTTGITPLGATPPVALSYGEEVNAAETSELESDLTKTETGGLEAETNSAFNITPGAVDSTVGGQTFGLTPDEGTVADEVPVDNRAETNAGGPAFDLPENQILAPNTVGVQVDMSDPTYQTFGWGFPDGNVPSAFKELEIDVSDITSYEKWDAASTEFKIGSGRMTAKQAEHWNELGQRLWRLDNDEKLDYSKIKNSVDISTFEANYRDAAGMGANEDLPESVAKQLDKIQKQIVAQENSTMSPEQKTLRILLDSDGFKQLTPGQQAVYIERIDLLEKTTYENRAEATAAVGLLKVLGMQEGNPTYDSAVNQLEQFDSMAGSETHHGYIVAEVIEDGKTRKVFKAIPYYVGKDGKTRDTNGALVNVTPLENITAADQKMVANMATKRTAYDNEVLKFQQALTNTQDLLDLVAIDDRVLTTVTANGVVLLENLGKEVRSLTSLLMDEEYRGSGEDGNVTIEDLEREALNSGILKPGQTLAQMTSNENARAELSKENMSETQRLATLKRLYDAKLALLQFQIGAIEGSSGNGLSDADREQFRQYLTGYKNVEEMGASFGAVLHAKAGVLETSRNQFDINSPEYQAFADRYGAGPAGVGAVSVADQFASNTIAGEDLLRSFNDVVTNRKMTPREKGNRYGDTEVGTSTDDLNTSTGTGDGGSIDYGDITTVTPDAVPTATKEDLNAFMNGLGSNATERRAALERMREENPALFAAVTQRASELTGDNQQ